MTGRLTQTVWRLRLAATCAVLTALAFLQSPGTVAADTKLDLTQDPLGFLARSLTLWDDQAFFGQLQNQAYGYLFPMGPFFAGAHVLGVPAWAVQRLWWALLLCLAFLGMVRLARLLGLTSPAARLVAGIAFAVSPRVVSTLAAVSVETWPYALAPWVLIPLVGLRDGGPMRRRLALSGLAVLAMGGVNAAASLVAASLGLLWILLEVPRPRRWRAAAGWVACGALAVAWWFVPLLLLGRYSPPFLDWIESAAVTTSITDASAGLRGVTHWVPYIAGATGPEWPGGWALVTERLLVAATAVVAVVSVAGLAAWRLAGRRFLVASLCIGLVAVTAAHIADQPLATGVLAEQLRILLDGVLAPLRNVHKAEVWLRLPLSLGVGYTVARLLRAVRDRPPATGGRRRPHRIAATVAVIAVLAGLVGTAVPAMRGDLTRGRTFVSVPGYWLETAGWLSVNARTTRALVLPGSPFGTYLWGEPRDEPLQPYASTPWAVRDAVPLSSAGNIRALDAVESLLSDGRPDPELAAYVARLGVGFIVVRNDLDLASTDAPRAVLVHAALEGSGGFTRVASFGPTLGTLDSQAIVADGGVDSSYPAVEIYRVDAAPSEQRAVVRDASAPVRLVGGPEGLLGARAVAAAEAVIRDGDPGRTTDSPTLLTDSARRWEVSFGRTHENRSRTLAEDEPWSLPRRVHDYELVPAGQRPVLRATGAVSVTASSSGGDAAALVSRPAEGPWAALDGSPSTAWKPLTTDAAPVWRLQAADPVDLSGIRVVVTTASGTRGSVPIVAASDSASVQVTARAGASTSVPGLGTSRTLTLTLPGPRAFGDGLAEVVVPGLRVSPSLVLPADRAPQEVVLRLRDGSRSPCVAAAGEPIACYAPLGRQGEEGDRISRVLPVGALTDLSLTVRPSEGGAAAVYLEPLAPAARATATSVKVLSAATTARAAVDRDASTAWIASRDDPSPSLTIRLPQAVRLSWVRLELSTRTAASTPLGVTVDVGGGRTYTLLADSDGYVRFPAARTDRVRLTFGATRPTLNFDTATRVRAPLPVGVSEVVLGEADAFRLPVSASRPVVTPCGEGPTVRVDGRAVRTRVTTDVGSILRGGTGSAAPCDPLPVEEGTASVVVEGSPAFTPQTVVWGRQPRQAATASTPRIDVWEPARREIVVESGGARLLELNENANPGWRATLDGQELGTSRADGWRQAFLLPAGSQGRVVVEFAPDRWYRWALLVGLAAALTLLVLALRRSPAVAAVRPVVHGAPMPAAAATTIAVAVSAVAVGPIGCLSALAAAVAVRRGLRAPWVAGAGAAMAVLPAVVWTWPSSTALPDGVAAAASVLVALGAGLAIGALTGVRLDGPIAGKAVPRPST